MNSSLPKSTYELASFIVGMKTDEAIMYAAGMGETLYVESIDFHGKKGSRKGSGNKLRIYITEKDGIIVKSELGNNNSEHHIGVFQIESC